VRKVSGNIRYQLNYFPEEKSMDQVYRAVDRSKPGRSMVHGGSGFIPLRQLLFWALQYGFNGSE
jgi:hypothetical protein